VSISARFSPPHLIDGDTPEELALTEEICRIVNGALDSLPPEQREALVRHDLQGCTYAQIAAEMGTPIGTVRSRIFRARTAIDRDLRCVFTGGLGREHRPGTASASCAVRRREASQDLPARAPGSAKQATGVDPGELAADPVSGLRMR